MTDNTKFVKLVKRETDDGLLVVMDDVMLGKKYLVYSEAKTFTGIHIPTGTRWTRPMYECVDGGWLPAEITEDATSDA